ncbi:MAG: bifunctional DNA-formamidopyrimidine glycosylase/DNA-(apurinic or apyrimidinic site) lyase [Aestuariivita sp.]|nr:bifunctional DNA-formamidopyrimidine glycosylase/DNA-(apurinic or apyrimidinic site) lyase [Aestuariivita sp.]
MPELPEVETILRGLTPVMSGGLIEKAEVNRHDLRWPLPERMAHQLTGQRITRLHRRSKFILAELSSNKTLLIHLGMSGRLSVSYNTSSSSTMHFISKKHDHVLLHLDSGKTVTYNDPRRFGMMDLCSTSAITQHKLLLNLGPEPFDEQFNIEYLTRILKDKRSPIKNVLLNQKIIAGLGNIYVCETLFRACIHPKREGAQISRRRITRLVPIIKEVLQDAINAGGSSLRDYRQTNGELGYFQHAFDVYGREGKKCRRFHCAGTIKRITQSGRSSFFCSKCQR